MHVYIFSRFYSTMAKRYSAADVLQLLDASDPEDGIGSDYPESDLESESDEETGVSPSTVAANSPNSNSTSSSEDDVPAPRPPPRWRSPRATAQRWTAYASTPSPCHHQQCLCCVQQNIHQLDEEKPRKIQKRLPTQENKDNILVCVLQDFLVHSFGLNLLG
jgi:hypothetical protein